MKDKELVKKFLPNSYAEYNGMFYTIFKDDKKEEIGFGTIEADAWEYARIWVLDNMPLTTTPA